VRTVHLLQEFMAGGVRRRNPPRPDRRMARRGSFLERADNADEDAGTVGREPFAWAGGRASASG
jgi:hypothetical protein